jgi:hypothetical protein
MQSNSKTKKTLDLQEFAFDLGLFLTAPLRALSPVSQFESAYGTGPTLLP